MVFLIKKRKFYFDLYLDKYIKTKIRDGKSKLNHFCLRKLRKLIETTLNFVN
jgi:hypothetical protein